jgi:protein AATF/BFR2
VSVGKSKLRRKEAVALGPQYRGARVSRDALDKDDDEDDEEDGDETRGPDGSSDYEDAREAFDDPDKADLERDQLEHQGEDAEIDSDDALCESDEEKFQGFTFRGSSQTTPVRGKKITRPTAADFMDDEAEESEDEGAPVGVDDEDDDDEEDEQDDASDLSGLIDDEEDEDDEDEDNEDDDDEEEGNSEDDDSDEDDDEDQTSRKSSKKGGRVDLKSVMSAGTQSVAGAVADSIQKDVEKGKAVRQQRKAFDAALNVRIRLQKALVAINSFPGAEDEDMGSEPYEAAEAAAVKLLNAIDDFRAGMQPKAGQKRKRELDVSSSSQDIWNSMQELERPAIARRKAVLDNWSKKVKATQMINSGAGKGSKLTKVDEPLTMMLENQMQDPERLIKRTRTPRSCAPVQAAQKVNEDPDIYDDADFYQLLLKELVDQRTTDTSAGGGGAAATVRYAAAKEAKTKKHVDTKASKGRKMRFNVHEKLQNFMAPEDRRGWEQHAIDRFFGTMFGQKMVLNEDEVSDEEMDGVTAEEEGLRLFRS